MATSVDAAIIEIADKLATLEPQLEGLRDFERLNLLPDTHAVVIDSINQYTRREMLMLAAQSALAALVADGYPVLDAREIIQAAYADLTGNAATIEAALAQFKPIVAANLRITAGTTELKSDP